MGDYVDLYKKAMTQPVDNWGKQAVQLGKELDLIDKELDKLEKNKKPSADELKKINDLKNKRKEVRAKMDQASLHLSRDLLALPLPKMAPLVPDLKLKPKPPDKDLIDLPKWLSKTIQQKGIPLGDDVTIVPNASVDFQKMKLKSFGLTLKWKFP